MLLTCVCLFILAFVGGWCIQDFRRWWGERTAPVLVVNELRMDVDACPLCGRPHRGLPVIEGYIGHDRRQVHVAICPETGDRIIMRRPASDKFAVPTSCLPN